MDLTKQTIDIIGLGYVGLPLAVEFGKVQSPQSGQYPEIVISEGHKQFAELGPAGIKAFGFPNAAVFEVKGFLPMGAVDGYL